MAKYHISEDGNPRVCRASKNPCRFGEAAHYGSKEEARDAYEITQQALANMNAEAMSEKEKDLQDYFLSFGSENEELLKTWKAEGLSQEDLNAKMYNHVQDTAAHSSQTLESLGWTDEHFDNISEARLQEASRYQDVAEPLPEKLVGELQTILNNMENKDLTAVQQQQKREITEILNYEEEAHNVATSEQEDEEYMAFTMIDDAEHAFNNRENLTPAFKGKLYQLLTDLEEEDSDYEYMAHKPKTRAQLAARLKNVMQAYETEWQIASQSGHSVFKTRVRQKTLDYNATAELFQEMQKRKFFVNDRQKAEKFYELTNKPGEHWYSNGAAEFKIFNENGNFRIYNFRNLQSSHIDDFFSE